MIKIKLITIGLLVSLMLVRCKNEVKKEILIPNLILNNNSFYNVNEISKQSELFNIEEIIALETNANSVFGNCTRILKRDDGFFVFDKDIAKSIFKFDLKGKLIYKIGKLGRGPGEFIRPVWFTIDNQSQYLYLLDSSINKMLIFNAKDGSFIKEINNISFNTISFDVLPGNNGFIFYNVFIPNYDLQKKSKLPQFIVTNKNGKVKNTFMFYNKKYFERTFLKSPYNFFSHQDSLFFVSQFVDTIYTINSNGIVSSKYRIDYLNNNTRRSKKYMNIIANGNSDDFAWKNKMRENSNVYRLMELFRTKNYIYLSGSYNKNTFYGLYNLVKMQGIRFNQNELEPDIIGSNFLFRFCDSKYFYALIYPSNILDKNNPSYKNISPKIQELLDNIEDNSTPMIIKFSIKWNL